MATFDIIIKNGRVADGSGRPSFPADVAIRGDRIEAVGKVDGQAARIIDATGKVVAPGFIDIHSHSEFILPLEKAPEILAPFIQQGITTLVTGNCGYSPAPVNPRTLEQMKSYTMFLKGEELSWKWTTFGEFLDHLERRGICMNMIPMVSHGAVRIHQVGFEGRRVTADEMETMKRLVRQACPRASSMPQASSRRRRRSWSWPAPLRGTTPSIPVTSVAPVRPSPPPPRR